MAGVVYTRTRKTIKRFRHDYYKTPRPQLDEGQIEEMEQLLSESLEIKTLLEITTWNNGFFTSKVGTVTKVDRYNKKIILRMNRNLIFILITMTSQIL